MLMHIDPGNINCREVSEFLYDYAERTLDERVLMAFDNHLLACEQCQAMVESYLRSNEAVKQHMAGPIQLPSELKERLVRDLTDQT